MYGKPHRYDAVLFLNGDNQCTGIMDSIFAHSHTEVFISKRFLLLCLLDQIDPVLDQIDPEVSNSSLVNIYKHLRFKYSVSRSGYVRSVMVDERKLIRPVILAVDLYWLKRS